MKDRIYWKIYFGFVVFLIAPLFAEAIIDYDKMPFIDFADYTLTVITLSGVFGYAFRKRLLNQNFWRYFLPGIIVWDIIIWFITERQIPDDPNFPTTTINILGWVTAILGYIAIYLYVYRSNNLWPHEERPSNQSLEADG